MDVPQAQEAFTELLEKIGQEHKAAFLIWIQMTWFARDCSGVRAAIAHHKLREIAEDIKGLLPLQAILPSEKLYAPTSQNPDCDARHTIHVDAFLYDEMDVDSLVDEGKLKNNYCIDCQSHNTAPLTFVTHSASIRRIEFIFGSLLPYMDGGIILDVGSRLGAVLYGAHIKTKASQIVGVEMNPDLCDLQKRTIEKHGMADRIRVICDDICNVPEIVQSANVVVLHNVFKFFLPPEVQRKTWLFLRKNITRTGTIVVSIPSLEDNMKDLQIDLDLGAWVKQRPITDPLTALTAKDQEELADVCTYEVV